jgi:hypothetical protein
MKTVAHEHDFFRRGAKIMAEAFRGVNSVDRHLTSPAARF